MIQYDLRQLFFFVTAAATFCAAERLIGPLLPLLVLGIIVVGTCIRLLRIENMVLGAVAGTAMTVAILLLVLVVVSPPSWTAASLGLLYPLVGYAVGMACAADRAFRSG